MRRRSGFTLVELLVVIGIIAFLFAISFIAVMGAVGSAREKATITTIRKVDAILTKRIEGFERWVKSEDEAASRLPGYITALERRDSGLQTMWLAGGNQRLTAKHFGKLECFRMMFPIVGSDTIDALPADASNAECLYWVIVNGPSFGVDAIETDAFTANEITDSDGDGLFEFVDGWGNPLRFYRWPTRLLRPALTTTDAAAAQTIEDPSGTPRYKFPIDTQFVDAGIWQGLQSFPSRGAGTTIAGETGDPLVVDPHDPTGRFVPGNPVEASNFEGRFYTPETFSLPLIVSAGEDATLGLYEPTDKANHGHLAQPIPGATGALHDNFTNRQQ